MKQELQVSANTLIQQALSQLRAHGNSTECLNPPQMENKLVALKHELDSLRNGHNWAVHNGGVNTTTLDTPISCAKEIVFLALEYIASTGVNVDEIMHEEDVRSAVIAHFSRRSADAV